MTLETPVLIVGGGPVGLTLAADLAWRGQSCLLVEERRGPTDHPKATLLGARSMELFRRWRLEERIYAAGVRQDGAYFIIFTTRLTGHELHRFASPSVADIRAQTPELLAKYRELQWSPYGKTQIGQQALEPILVRFADSLAPRLQMRHGWRMTDFTADADGVTASIGEVGGTASETVRAQYLVGCDGGASGVRRSLGIRHNGRGTMRANVSFYFRSAEFLKTHGLGRGNLYFLFAPDSFGVFTAIDGEALWSYQHYFLDATRETRDLDATEVLHRAMGAPFAFELLATTHWHHHQSVAREWRRGRVFLAGDAAHLFPPTGGVGMNTGIGDACDLAWKLDGVLSGWAGEWLLDSYQAERKPVAVRNSVISANNSDKIDMVMDETPADIEQPGAAGDRLRAELKAKIGWMSRQFNSGGTHLGYRYVDSPICVPDSTPEPPDDPTQVVPSTWPGSRAPHAWLEPGVSTLDWFGRDFVLLQFGGETPAALLEAARERALPLRLVTCDKAAIAALYHSRLLIIRPDGHVAWRGDSEPEMPLEVIDRLRGASPPAHLSTLSMQIA